VAWRSREREAGDRPARMGRGQATASWYEGGRERVVTSRVRPAKASATAYPALSYIMGIRLSCCHTLNLKIRAHHINWCCIQSRAPKAAKDTPGQEVSPRYAPLLRIFRNLYSDISGHMRHGAGPATIWFYL
jgi:hypothetical protein